MSQKLIDLSPDLRRLKEDGFEIEVKSDYLLIHHVPYLNSAQQIAYGTLVSSLTLAGEITSPPTDHVAHFIGETPYDHNGLVISQVIGQNDQLLAPGITINQTFSSKPSPARNYFDYYEKVNTYVKIISASAKHVDPSVTEKTFAVVGSSDPESVFNYRDTNSSNAKVNSVTSKLIGHRMAIIGLGGTGSYILDLIAKTPVNEIHLFDGDYFLQNNAFRTPGAPSLEKLRERLKKTDYLCEIYSKMHKGIFSHNYFVNSNNVSELLGFDFVFVCVDKGGPKKVIIDFLVENKISFIDVGMGIQNKDDKLNGQIRVTASTPSKRDHISRRISFAEAEENEYSKNIQIADLNALNASLAVIKWKKIFGFYYDSGQEYNSTLIISSGKNLNDEIEA